MNIIISTIPHIEQRYNTAGDWYYFNNDLYIKVSNLGNWKYEFLIGLHEFVEAFLCKHNKISEKQVDKFDFEFEKKRKQNNFDEAGDNKNSPYRTEHCVATGIERIAAAFIRVCWADYEKKLQSL